MEEMWISSCPVNGQAVSPITSLEVLWKVGHDHPIVCPLVLAESHGSLCAELGELPEGSPHIASLLTIIRPRYHVTSQPPLFFNRAPYVNPDLGAGRYRFV